MPSKSRQALAPQAGQMKLSFGVPKPEPVPSSDPAQKENVARNTPECPEAKSCSQTSRNSKKRTQEQISTSQEEDAVAARRSGAKPESSGSPGKAKGGSAEKRQSSFLAKAGESKNMGTKRLKRNDEDSPVRAEPTEL